LAALDIALGSIFCLTGSRGTHLPFAAQLHPSAVKQPQLDSAVHGQFEHSQFPFTGAAPIALNPNSDKAKNVENSFICISLFPKLI
jgi:hypothetical protein